ncbi:hypothetical protein [Microbacterium aquimaris]|uniref:Uncharacterized protein n=1 Tax=Microbacterium aquimaris TaxID=459816 RepID=A0ABU5N882_9MICO|nr:hypothetical protein [Microbacterium aquimaris]MDZ8162221.1 hypothetical protein [Microbacterium aquimaris]MDZ8275889.1 hypothetical protein [Microbacterium aquimaris]
MSTFVQEAPVVRPTVLDRVLLAASRMLAAHVAVRTARRAGRSACEAERARSAYARRRGTAQATGAVGILP